MKSSVKLMDPKPPGHEMGAAAKSKEVVAAAVDCTEADAACVVIGTAEMSIEKRNDSP
jgi:hypothetical protein